MADIRLVKPVAQTTQNIPSAPDGRFIFDFPTDEATLSRAGDDLLLTFEDGAVLRLQNFYTTYSKDNMPSFEVEGAEIAGEDFFMAMNEPDLMPAAGPARATAQSNGNRFHDYVTADLLGGLDRLGGLDIDWPGGDVTPETDGGATAFADIDYGVTVTPGNPGHIDDDTPVIDNPDNPHDGGAEAGAGRDMLRVQEAGLRGEGNATASSFMTVNAPNGVATIVIGGVVVFDGSLTGNIVPTDEGYLEVTGFDAVSGRLDYTYHLTQATQEHQGEGADSIAHDLVVTVTDTDGSTGTGVVSVVITDDVPTIESFTHTVTEGADTAVTGDALEGAAAGADGADFAWTNPAQQGQYGEITLNPDGTYSYTLDNDNAAVKALSDGQTLTEEFTYTYTDADGDVATGSVTITISGVDNGVVVTPSDPSAESEVVTVYESGLADGSQAGQAAAPTTAEGSLSISAPDGVVSIKIGNVTVFENGALTGSTVSTDEGVLTVTDFDAATGELKFTYELTGNTLEHDTDATDTQVSHDLAVTVTDADGSEAGSTITVTVVDDVPTIESFTHGVMEGDATPVTGDALEGAVAGADADATFAWNANQSGTYGEITLNPDGTYSYTLDNDNEAVKALSDGETLTEEFTYTYTDADGDIATGSVTITINGVDNGVVVTPSDPEAGSETLTVYESGLADGSTPGAKPTTAEGSLTITAPDGVASIKIGNVTVFENGALTGSTVSTDEGVLTVTDFDAATGELKFTYNLTGNTTEHNTQATDTQVSHDLAVTVTDADGSEAGSTITVTVVDDVPTIESFTHGVMEGDATPVTGDALEGAVAGADADATFAWNANQSGTYGEITLNPDGTYSYTLDNDNEAVKALSDGETLTEEFTYTYTDADGDVATGSVTITISGVDNGVVVTPSDPSAESEVVTVYESGLADGSQAGQAAAPTTAEGSLSISAPDGVASIKIGNVTVFENGALTGSTVSTDEGVLTVTDFDAATGELKFTYELTGNTLEHDTDATDTQVSHDLAVTVTDADGTEAGSTITVTVVDDVPVAVADSVTLTEAAARAGGSGDNVLKNDVFGADAPENTTVSSVNGGTPGEAVNGAYGKLTLNADGTYTYKLNAGVDVPKGETYTENFTYTITDKDGDTSEATLTITIKGDENVPVVTVDTPEPGDANIMVDEGKQPEHGSEGHAQSGSGSFTVQLNGEDGVITVGGEDGWTVTVTGEDVAVTGSVVTVNGVAVTVTGATQAADGTWTVNYEYELTGPQTHGPDGSATDASLTGEIAISVTDATGDTDSGKLTVEVHDDVPVAKADSVTLTEAAAQAGGSGASVLANDVFGADAPADKTVTSIEGGTPGQPVSGQYGTLTLNENGTYTYTLNAGVDVPKGSTYTEEFTYTIMDKDGDTSEATLTITIKGDENVPVVTVDTPEGSDASITVDEGALQAGSGQHAEHGVSGTDSFTVQLNGEDGVITVGGENGWTVTVTGDSAKVTGDVVTVNGVAVTVTGATQAADGSWTVNYQYELGGGQQHGTPATGDYHTDELTGSIAISVTDATGDTAEGKLTVEVHDDGPVAKADSVTLTEAAAQAGGSGASVLANDVFGADAPADKTVTSIEGGTLGQPVDGTYGKLTLNADGTYTYTLNAGVDVPKDATYTEEFTYTITDKDGDTSEATLTITIKGDENVPVVTVDTPEPGDANIMVDEGKQPEHGGEGHAQSGSGSFTVQLNGEDGVITVGGEDGWTVTVTGDSAAVTGDVVTVNGVAVTVTGATQAADGTWTVNYEYELTGPQTHGPDGSATDASLTGEIAISVTDATGDTDSGKLTVEVHDDVPVAKADSVTLTEAEAQAGGSDESLENVLTNDVFGADAPADKTVTSIEGGTPGQPVSGKHGTLTLNENGTYTYQLNEGVDVPKGETYTENFTYTITDKDGDTSEATLTITIKGDENVPVVTVDTPEPGDANIMVDEGKQPEHGGEGHAQSGSGSFTVQLNGEDGVITVGGEDGWTVTVTGEDVAVTGSVVTVNGVAVTVTGATQAADGTWTVNYEYELTGPQTHGPDGSATDASLTGEIAISVTDATGDTDSGKLTVEVHDDVPVAKADSVTLTEAAAQAGGSDESLENVLTNDVFGADAPADKTVTSIEGGTLGQPVSGKHGTLTLNENGTYTYQLNEGVDVPKGETYTEEFTYTITDKDGDTSEATLTITIKGDENVPVVTVDTPEPGDANIMVDEGKQPEHDGEGHAQSGTGSFTVQLNGEDGVITVGGESGWKVTVTGDSANVTGSVVTVNGVEVTVTGATQAADGTWTVNYEYVLTGPQTHGPDGSATDASLTGEIAISVTDATGDTDSGKLTVEVHDDVPVAKADSVTLTEAAAQAGGSGENVLTNDVFGADAPADKSVTSIEGGTLGQPVDGTYGTLTLNENGTYTYTLNAGVDVPKGSTYTEEFTYTITDKDGDTSEATLTITIKGDENVPVVTVDTPEPGDANIMVDEGKQPEHDGEGHAQSGTGSFTVQLNGEDGVITVGGESGWKVTVTGDSANVTGSVVTVNGVEVTVTGATQAADGTWTVNYEYVLTGPQTHGPDGSATDASLTGEIAISVTDATGDTDSGKLTVEVHDDVPVAKADSVTLTEAAAQAGGSDESLENVLTNDVFGADAPADKTVTSIEGGTLGQPVSGKHGTLTLNENGTYTYQLNEGVDVPKGDTYTEEFTYTITDKDGDTSEAKLTITITGDANEPVVTVEAPEPGDANIMVDEGKQPEHGGEGHAQSGSGSFTVQLNGEDGVITVGGESGWKVTVTGDSANVTGSVVTVNGVAVTVTGATQAADGSWTVNYSYALGGPQTHGPDGSATDASLTGEIAISVTDATGDTDSGKLTVEVHDDVPTISASGTTSLVPGGGAGNLADGQAENFTQGGGGQSLGHSFALAGWDGVTMYAAKVTYSGSGNDVQISKIDGDDNYTLKYSPYKGNSKFTSSDWGLTVDAGNYDEYGNYDSDANHNEEISVIKDAHGNANQSEAVVFDLGGQLAYGVTIDFGAFYNGEPGATGTTQWDHVSEKALVTFYRDGQIVGSTLVEGESSNGTFTLNSSDVVLGGFDMVVISAVDNRTPQFQDENSDFTIQGIDFITKRDDPIIVSEGTVTAKSGADGFADAYAGSHVQFDLAGMVNEDSLSEDGTSGTVTVLVDGIEQTVKLELSEGSSGESILTGTLQESGEDGKPVDGEQLFTATLDKNGNWTMEQYEQFRVAGEDGQASSNQFELVFKTEDADGDIVGATVNVPLEVVDQTPGTDTGIGNGDDVITITGGDGVAGTVAAGDSGGMTEGQQVAANYNVCFVLDTSGSMDERVGDKPGWWQQDTRPTRLDIAVESIENFIDTSIHQGDFVGTVNLAVVTFASTYGDTIDVSITRVSDGQGGYTETYTLGTSSYSTYDAFSTAFHSRLNMLDANGGTNYQAGFHNAAEWFGELDNPSGADGNITYFLSDGEPTFHGTSSEGGGNYATLEDVQGAWTGYQELLDVASGMQVNAIGFGNDLDANAMKTLAMLDNTGTPVSGVEGNQAADGYLYYGRQGTTKWPPNTGTITNGNATQVTDGAGLSAAFTSGFNPGALVAAGDDTITAEGASTSSIIYGDVMNTDRLLHELNQNDQIQVALVAAGIGYGSGTEVFQWLENPDNANLLAGTEYEGWTHTDTVDYMLEHAEELGYETLVSNDGTFYLADAHGDVWNMDGSEAGIALDDLTGRGGGNDVITGSEASDTIYGQEGVDTIHGGSGDDTIYGGSGDDTIYGGDGNDYIDGGAGADTIHGGSGNDIIVYDANDVLVDGGDGIDFMVSKDTSLSLDTLLGENVQNVEVLITGDDALSLTSMDQLAADYGITIGTDDAGNETLTLDMTKWTEGTDGSYTFNSDSVDLTLQLDAGDGAALQQTTDDAAAQQVFLLQNSNG